MKHFLEEIGKLWCIYLHAEVMWPFRGRYQCRICLREYAVAFEANAGHGIDRHGHTLGEAAEARA